MSVRTMSGSMLIDRFERGGGGIERREIRAGGAKHGRDHLPRLLLIVDQDDFDAAQSIAMHERVAERVPHRACTVG